MEEDKNDIIEETDNKGWFANVLAQLTKTFNSFINIFKKHGIIFTIFMMLLFVCFWTLIINPIRVDNIIEKRLEMVWQKEKDKTNQDKEDAIERRYNADEIVGDIMTKLIDKFNVDRVLLLEKHNSVMSLGNVDFLYLSCSLEMLSPTANKLAYISEDLQRQVVLNLLGSDMIGTLKHRDYIYYNDVTGCNHPQHRLIHKLRDAGDKECLIIPFKDKNHRPLLLLVVTGENLDVDGIIDYVEQFSKQITDLLIC